MTTRDPVNVMVFIAVLVASFALALYRPEPKHRCEFDRNEPGPLGANGSQWWWEYYKCDDGTERRMLVAGPRG